MMVARIQPYTPAAGFFRTDWHVAGSPESVYHPDGRPRRTAGGRKTGIGNIVRKGPAMRIIVTDAGISTGSLFKLVSVGFTIGAGVFLIPVFPVIALTGILWMHEGLGFEGVFAAIFLPFVLAANGLLLGAVVLFGLWIYRKFRVIEVRPPEA